MDEGGDGGGVAVVQAHGDGEDFVGGGGGEGNAEVGAVWVCGDEGCGEEGGEDEGCYGERPPDRRKGVKGRHSDGSRLGLELRLLKFIYQRSKDVMQTHSWGKTNGPI